MRWRKLKGLLGSPATGKAFMQNLTATFSQYGEDHLFKVLLQPGPQGTYLDIGSHHPVEGSNSFRLYLNGWRGVTVDPNPAFAPLYRRFRPEGVHLVEGVSAEVGALTYFDFENSVYNTLSAERAAEVQRIGEALLTTRTVPCRPLAAIVAEHLPGRQIDLLSVDCEGLDLAVLRSLDLSVNRPTVMIVEDYERLHAFREEEGESALHDFLVAHRYRPIAQMAFSAIYVATDWPRLMRLSSAYDVTRIQGGILPVPTEDAP